MFSFEARTLEGRVELAGKSGIQESLSSWCKTTKGNGEVSRKQFSPSFVAVG